MENPLVAGGLTLVFFGIGSFFGSVCITVAGFVLVAIGLSAGRESPDAPRKIDCPSCGAKNDRESDVCHRCGTVLSKG